MRTQAVMIQNGGCIMVRRTALTSVLLGLLVSAGLLRAGDYKKQAYEPTWESLIQHPTPEWFKDAKFGIYFHWGVYSVPAYENEWYPRRMYLDEMHKRLQVNFFEHHRETWGPQEHFGYKDFIPMFTAEKFNADEWVDLFVESGARYIGPVAEHHDGFAMWDSKLTGWDAADMGPKRDLVGEIAVAARKRGLKFMTSFHHAYNWKYYEPAFKYDAKDPRYAGLYGTPHAAGAPESKAFLEDWLGKIVEVVDRYEPDYIWFDFGWRQPTFEPYKREFLAYYYNKAAEWGKNVVVSYKHDHLPVGAGVLDLERGRLDSLRKIYWITDTAIGKKSWSYISRPDYKPVNTMVDALIDRVSKNGNTLMNIAPRADGTIPEEQKKRLLAIGEWLKLNGEAIYGTRHWYKYGEGPTLFKGGGFIDRNEINYTAEDIRFTTKGNTIYAIALDWPGEEMVVESFREFDAAKIKRVTLLGVDRELQWQLISEGLQIQVPEKKPCDNAYSFKIEYSERLPWKY
jgi:alpha-L-fucosidase